MTNGTDGQLPSREPSSVLLEEMEEVWLPGSDPESGRPYYYNSVTYETRWEWPKIISSDREWREKLSADEYEIMIARGCEVSFQTSAAAENAACRMQVSVSTSIFCLRKAISRYVSCHVSPLPATPLLFGLTRPVQCRGCEQPLYPADAKFA